MAESFCLWLNVLTRVLRQPFSQMSFASMLLSVHVGRVENGKQHSLYWQECGGCPSNSRGSSKCICELQQVYACLLFSHAMPSVKDLTVMWMGLWCAQGIPGSNQLQCCPSSREQRPRDMSHAAGTLVTPGDLVACHAAVNRMHWAWRGLALQVGSGRLQLGFCNVRSALTAKSIKKSSQNQGQLDAVGIERAFPRSLNASLNAISWDTAQMPVVEWPWGQMLLRSVQPSLRASGKAVYFQSCSW